ncbi:MAG TPA: glycosyltransferase family 2 protein, partial [Dongiaceae bacterium]|nr:glycosyltransferase family 2 protein [Dongiaceae bacterium]
MSAPSPAVSFIIPARNAAAVLATALECLLRQTRIDWEAIVIDDQSSDATGALALGYCHRDSRFRMLEGPGRGVSAARNAGLKAASGTWLVFLDADDWVVPAYLETMLKTLEADPGSEAAYCQYQHVMPDGDTLPTVWVPAVAQMPFEIFARHCAVAIHSVVVRRSVVAGLNGFDESL